MNVYFQYKVTFNYVDWFRGFSMKLWLMDRVAIKIGTLMDC